MGKKQEEYRKLSREELNQLAGEELPERAAMSLINANVAAPVNAAVALNVLSDNSAAIANAELGMVPDERVLHAGYAAGDLFELPAFLRCRIEECCHAGPSLR